MNKYTARKAAWITLAALLFVPHLACYGAAKVDELIIHVGERLYVWSHAYKYRRQS